MSSNDTREALAAKAKDAVRRVAAGSASVKAALDEIDRLAALTEQPAAPQALPGFVLVPKEPTQAMVWKGHDALGPCVGSCGEASPPSWADVADAYRAMLAAAPAAPAQEPQQPAPRVRPLLDIATSLAEHLHQVQDWIEEHLAAAASSPAPAVQPTEKAVPCPVVAGWTGPGAFGRVWLRLGDGPEETEYVPAEAVAELVEALGTARPYVVAASTRYYDGVNGHLIRSEAVNRIAEIDALIAKHGQPQGGSNG